MDQNQTPATPVMPSGPILEARDLCKSYDGRPALSISVTFDRGRVIGLLGPNGSGKTTLLKLAAGLLAPTSGQLLIGGMPVGPRTKEIVSYLPERNSIPLTMTVAEAVEFFRTMFPGFGRDKAIAMLEKLQVPGDRRIRALSKGMREKVQIVLVMSRNAQLYLLDEPLGGVDPASRDYILDTVIRQAAPGSTVLFSTHLIRDVEPFLDDFIFLQNGRPIMADSVAHVHEGGRTLDDLFREVFRC